MLDNHVNNIWPESIILLMTRDGHRLCEQTKFFKTNKIQLFRKLTTIKQLIGSFWRNDRFYWSNVFFERISQKTMVITDWLNDIFKRTSENTIA